MERIFLCILSLSVSGALIGAVLLLIHPLTKRWFSRKWNYYIWLLVAARLLIPVHIETASSLQNVAGLIFTFEAAAQGNEFEPVNEFANENESKSESESGIGNASKAENKFANGNKIADAAPIESLAGETKAEAAETKKEIAEVNTKEDGTKAEAASQTESPDVESPNTSKQSNRASAQFINLQKQPAIEKLIAAFSGNAAVNGLLLLSVIWLAGAGVSLFVKIIKYRRFTSCLRKSSEKITGEGVNAIVKGLAERLRIKKTPAVYESGLAPVPITFGLCKPVVILPKEERDSARLSLILHHELIHVKRKDLWYKWLYQLLLCVHWFNPVLYLIGRKMSIDCELACDEAVLACLTGEGRKAYGNILINTAERNLFFKENVPSTTLLERRKDLKERLKGILHYKKQGKFKVLLSVCMLLCLLYLSACGSVQVSRDAMPLQFAAREADEFLSSVGIFNYDVDKFLAEPWTGNRNGLGKKMYDDESLIAGADDTEEWRAYSYAGGDNRLTSRGFVLSGSDSVLIVQASEETPLEVESSFELVKGEFKIVHVKPDKSVELIDDTGKEAQREITLGKGRNVIKMVGWNAKLKELSISFPGLSKRDFDAVYSSEEEEYAGEALKSIASGNINKDKLMDSLVYMDAETASEVLSVLLEKGIPLTDEELSNLLIYSDTKLSSRYLAEAAEKGNFAPDGETLEKLMPYLENDGRGKLLGAMGEALDWQTLRDSLPYLNEEEIKECLLAYMENGNRISFAQFEDISPFLSDGIGKELDRYLEGK
ncbi:MAG: M56 family metallopeptidase [Clostridium sp.]|nr:M56 family metallopeptidase [Clostridium sp.]